jgi:hypothetical protein
MTHYFTNDYVESKDKEINRLNNIIDKYEKPLIFLKNRIQQGMSIEEQNKYSIQYVNNISSTILISTLDS